MEKCAGAVITWLIRQHAIEEKDRELYAYAAYNMLLSAAPLILVLIFGMFLGGVRQGIVMILPYMMIRKFSGGYHAKTLKRCLLFSSLALVLCIEISLWVSWNWKLLVLTVAAGCSLMLFSPIDSENRRLEAAQKHQYQKIVCRFVVLFLIMILVTWKSGADEYALCIAVGIILSAGLQIPCLVKRSKINQNRP